MSRSFSALLHRRTVVVAATAALTVAVAAGTASAGGWSGGWSGNHHRAPTVDAGSDYLALGDSVAFGYREATNLPTPDYPDAASFVGYPEDVASGLGLRLANAACSGETSGSFVTPGAPSNGCENSPQGVGKPPVPVGYRTLYPLHVSYRGTQLSYAVSYLRSHRDTRLVTLGIGANDGFLCESTTADSCATELSTTLATVSANVRTILSALRHQGGYDGQIVIVNYYSLDYSSSADNTSSQQLNTAMDSAAKPFGVTVADGYGLFQKAAAQVGGNSCTAGLLTTLNDLSKTPPVPTGGCGVHPSVGGQSLLALAVEQAIQR